MRDPITSPVEGFRLLFHPAQERAFPRKHARLSVTLSPSNPSTYKLQSPQATMFGRRRRPILGAAVVVSASRAAARREVQQQAAMESQREMQVQYEVDARIRQEAEQERRTRRAVDDAIKEASEKQAAQQMPPQPAQQSYNTQPPLPTSGLQDTPATNATFVQQPEQLRRTPSPQLPQYSLASLPLEARPKSAQGLSAGMPAVGSKNRYCTQCGFGCQLGDKFCRQCGAKQVD